MHKPAYSRADPDARRADLIAATRRVLAKGGAGAATVRAIATEAGVSPGLIAHHFGGVDALIAETYAAVGAAVQAALDAAVLAAGADARARLSAYVAASFVAPIADAELLATWIAFWSLVGARPEIARLHDAIYGTYRLRLEGLLGDCGVDAAAVRLATIAITALVDGLWLELCLSPTTFDASEARMIAERQISDVLRVR